MQHLELRWLASMRCMGAGDIRFGQDSASAERAQVFERTVRRQQRTMQERAESAL